MYQSTVKVRLAQSNESFVDFDVESRQFVLKMGASELRFCPLCFRKFSDVLVRASREFDKIDDLGRVDQITAKAPEDLRFEKLLRSPRLNWIRAGKKS